MFGQERPESLPKMMCRFLFYCLDNVTDGICRVVSAEDMHVVFAGFHRHDFVVMSISDALNLLFYGIIDVSSQQLLAIFRHKDDVYFETISFFYTGLGTSLLLAGLLFACNFAKADLAAKGKA